ncbi:hypothetical protein SH668x_002657 [Planctomicrobium sp. SH668]|uniref:hypothetical protein n=1 Tax=Planctomicrobium sp. SH668 TaxID=3448126 RepID=UPI003F5B012D
MWNLLRNAVALLCFVSFSLQLVLGNDDNADRNTHTDVQELDVEVHALIESLNSLERKVRAQAESRLVEIGLPVTEGLHKAAEGANSGLLEVLNRVEREVEIQAARDSLKGSLVTVKWTGEQQYLEPIGHDLFRQADNGGMLEHWTEFNSHKISELSFESIPFWEGFDRLCRKGEIGWDWYSGSQLQFNSERPLLPEGQIEVLGPIRIQSELLPPANLAMTEEVPPTCRARIRFDLEPHFACRFLRFRDGDFSLTQGDAIWRAFSPESLHETEFAGDPFQTIDISLRRPDGLTQPPQGVLKGEVQAFCQLGEELLEFSLDQAPGARRIAGAMTVEFLSAVSDDAGGDVTIRVTYPDGTRWDSHRVDGLYRWAWLAKGSEENSQPIHSTNVSVKYGETSVHEVRFRFPALESDLKEFRFEYFSPWLYESVELPIELQFVAP